MTNIPRVPADEHRRLRLGYLHFHNHSDIDQRLGVVTRRSRITWPRHRGLVPTDQTFMLRARRGGVIPLVFESKGGSWPADSLHKMDDGSEGRVYKGKYRVRLLISNEAADVARYRGGIPLTDFDAEAVPRRLPDSMKGPDF